MYKTLIYNDDTQPHSHQMKDLIENRPKYRCEYLFHATSPSLEPQWHHMNNNNNNKINIIENHPKYR